MKVYSIQLASCHFFDFSLPVYNRRYYVRDQPDTIYGGDFSPSDDQKFAVPVFTSSQDRKSIWSAILEKAYAKYYGQFEVIEGKEWVIASCVFG